MQCVCFLSTDCDFSALKCFIRTNRSILRETSNSRIKKQWFPNWINPFFQNFDFNKKKIHWKKSYFYFHEKKFTLYKKYEKNVEKGSMKNTRHYIRCSLYCTFFSPSFFCRLAFCRGTAFCQPSTADWIYSKSFWHPIFRRAFYRRFFRRFFRPLRHRTCEFNNIGTASGLSRRKSDDRRGCASRYINISVERRVMYSSIVNISAGHAIFIT